MAITYSWKIDMMHTQSKFGVQSGITEIHWSKHGVDENGVIGRYPGCTKFTIEEIAAKRNQGNFTEFSNLTEAQVIGWIQSGIIESDMTFIDSQIQSSIDHQKTPKISNSIDSENLPWATS
jgi:hypothetical protein